MGPLTVPPFLQKRGIAQVVSLDFETYFDTHYTLKKMSTSLYIYDERFFIHGAGIDGRYYSFQKLYEKLKSIDWSVTALLCHHTQFDGLILSHIFNIKPTYYMCSMSMARPYFKNTVGAGLDAVSKALGHAGKTSDILQRTKGQYYLSPVDDKEMADYCIQDVDEMKLIFTDLLPLTTETEMDLIDMTIRMYACPRFMCDIPRITKEVETQTLKRTMTMLNTNLVPKLRGEPLLAHCKLQNIKMKKNDTRLSLTETILRSPILFAKALEEAGATVPTKISRTTNSKAYAFAKTDVDFLALAKHPNEQVQRLFHGRMAAKSTTALDKAEKLLEMSKHGPIPVYLNYWPTQTGRWSGGDKIQLQNMPRGGEMRKSLIVDSLDKYLLVIDSSGIEMRMLAWFSDNTRVLDMIRNGMDVYVDMAAKIYNIPYNQVSKLQRFIGKIAILGLGYGCGAQKFQMILESGAMGPPVNISLSEAQTIVSLYRQVTNAVVAQLWERADDWLQAMIRGDTRHYKGLTFSKDKVTLPDGTQLHYPNLRGDWSWNFDKYINIKYQGPNKQTKYIYGGLFVENLVQALARSVLAKQTLEGSHLYPCLLMVHDEGVYEIPRFRWWSHGKKLYEIFTTSPKWCHDLPLDAEYGVAREYSK